MSIVTVLATVGIVAVASMALASHDVAEARPDQKALAKQPVFACRLGALTPQERVQQQETRARLERGTIRVSEDADGYTFHYAANVPAASVMSWIEMERKCCPFLSKGSGRNWRSSQNILSSMAGPLLLYGWHIVHPWISISSPVNPLFRKIS